MLKPLLTDQNVCLFLSVIKNGKYNSSWADEECNFLNKGEEDEMVTNKNLIKYLSDDIDIVITGI